MAKSLWAYRQSDLNATAPPFTALISILYGNHPAGSSVELSLIHAAVGAENPRVLNPAQQSLSQFAILT